MPAGERVHLKLLASSEYKGVNGNDPIRFYYWPVFGRMYRRRVELCLEECPGGERILEVGFGTGLTFLNLHDTYREIHGLDLTADVAHVRQVFEAHGVQTHLKQGSVLEMPYEDNTFDMVLLISILEHLQPDDQVKAFAEIRRVLKPGGHVVYGVPIERPFMVVMFRTLGYDIRQHHFSTQDDVRRAAASVLEEVKVKQMKSFPPGFGDVYEIGNFRKPAGASASPS